MVNSCMSVLPTPPIGMILSFSDGFYCGTAEMIGFLEIFRSGELDEDDELLLELLELLLESSSLPFITQSSALAVVVVF